MSASEPVLVSVSAWGKLRGQKKRAGAWRIGRRLRSAGYAREATPARSALVEMVVLSVGQGG